MTSADGRCTCTGVGCWHRGRCQAWEGRPHPVTRELVVLDNGAGWCGPCTPDPTDRRSALPDDIEPEPLFP
jgi:hypothetical protein